MTQRHGRRRLHRAAAGVASGAVDALNPRGVQLLLDAVLFDAAGIPDWHALAACHETDPTVFFPGNGPEAFARQSQALAICRDCPVQTECLDDALSWEQPSTRAGIRGGLSAAARQRLYLQHREHGGDGAGDASTGVAA